MQAKGRDLQILEKTVWNRNNILWSSFCCTALYNILIDLV